MKSISLCFQVHHPFHFQTYRFLDIGSNKSYYNEPRIEREIIEAAEKYYLPTNEFLLKLISKTSGKLKLAFYISGTAIEQFLMYKPELLNSFKQLADTGQIEFLGSTSSHSLISLTNQKTELINQIKDYQAKIGYYFGKKPNVFVNSDLMYSDLMGKDIYESGYRAMITNGTRKILTWQSPGYVYSNCFKPEMHVYFRNELISNQLEEQLNKLNSEESNTFKNSFLAILNNLNKEEPVVNFYTDYKILGGVGLDKKHSFLKTFVSQVNRSNEMEFVFPSEISELYGPVAAIKAYDPICWVNHFHSDYYPGNELQTEAIKQLYLLRSLISEIDNINLQADWNFLQTSDHIHLMDDQHPEYRGDENSDCIYKTKYDAFINFMNILDDFRLRLIKESKKKEKKPAQIKSQKTPVKRQN